MTQPDQAAAVELEPFTHPLGRGLRVCCFLKPGYLLGNWHPLSYTSCREGTKAHAGDWGKEI